MQSLQLHDSRMIASRLFHWNYNLDLWVLLKIDQLKFKRTNQNFRAGLRQVACLNDLLTKLNNTSTKLLFNTRQIVTISFDKMDHFLNNVFDSSCKELLNCVEAGVEPLIYVHERILKRPFPRTFYEWPQFSVQVILLDEF